MKVVFHVSSVNNTLKRPAPHKKLSYSLPPTVTQCRPLQLVLSRSSDFFWFSESEWKYWLVVKSITQSHMALDAYPQANTCWRPILRKST